MQTSNAQDISRLVAGRYLNAAHARRMQQLTQPRETPQPGTPDKAPDTTSPRRPQALQGTGPSGAVSGERVPVNANANALERLLADWGKAGSPHDLDGDGTVGIKDMLELLARMSDPAVQDDKPAEDQPATNEARLKELLADWGESGSPHDLDGDGTVGIKDMLALLARMSEAAGQDDEPPADQQARLESLLAEWGKASSTNDLDGDGIVGIKDMLELLARMSETPGQDDEPPADQQARLESLLAEWGKASSTNDLDGDGTVGIKDMLALLARMSETPAADNADEPTGQQARLAALLEQWGKADSAYDLDGDGTVGIKDMLAMLARMSGQHGEDAPAPAGAGPPGSPAGPAAHVHAAYQSAAAENIARSLMPHVGSTEPAELRAAIVESNLPQLQKAAVLHRLSAWYRGHGLSLVG